MLRREPDGFKIDEHLNGLALLRCHAEDIEKSHQLQFSRYEEEGLGPTIGGVFTTPSGRTFVLTENLLSPYPRLNIAAAASGANREALDDILAELGVTAEDCLWTLTEGYEPVPHSVFREDDNGHRSLVGEFPSRIDALLKIEELSRGGHKQHYWEEPTTDGRSDSIRDKAPPQS